MYACQLYLRAKYKRMNASCFVQLKSGISIHKAKVIYFNLYNLIEKMIFKGPPHLILPFFLRTYLDTSLKLFVSLFWSFKS